MSITATFQRYNEDEKLGEPFTKDFYSLSILYDWYRKQDGYPYLFLAKYDVFDDKTSKKIKMDTTQNCQIRYILNDIDRVRDQINVKE